MITIDVRWLSVSGIGTYLRNLVPGIIAAFPREDFCLLGDPGEMQRHGLLRQANVIPVSAAASMYSVREQFEIARKIPRSTRLYLATHYNVPLLYRGRMLVTVYDLFHVAMPELVGGWHKSVYARCMFEAVRRKAAAIITISRFTRDELIRYTGERPQAQPIHPIHLGVDDSWFDIPRLANPHGRPYLLYVGNVKPHKNLGALVKAFTLVTNDIGHDLLIVGKKEGFITGDTASMFDAERLLGRVNFTGYVTDESLKQYMAHADAFVFPSLYEGFGLPPLEAMASGSPVIASNAASLPEICGDAALYCDPRRPEDIAARIRELLGNHALRDSLIRKGRAHARQFTWDACIARTCEVMRGLLIQ